MTTHDSSTRRGPAATIGATGPNVTGAPGVVRTGARLGWWPAALGVAAVVLGVRYIAWRLAQPPPNALAVVFLACEVVSLAIFVMTLVTLFARGARAGPVSPAGTLDVFVTVCGEPLDVVERAVLAAIAIDYPHRTYVLNDGRVAAKPGWELIDELAERLGATALTRSAGHRAKAGNLNHALTVSTADFVATIDADHRADPDLGHRLLRWFGDPAVAFVAAAQRFEPDCAMLNNRERFFFDLIQPAKDAAGCAISCGSGVAYRRRALDDIGGFSEWNVVEDLHTSYRLHAAGWTSVYEQRAVTTGLAPRTVGEYATQRARWALDSLRILFFDSPLRRRGVRFGVRWHYLQTTASYLMAVPQTMFIVGAPLYLVLRLPLTGGASGWDYLFHAVPWLGALVWFFVAVLGRRDAMATFRTSLFLSTISIVAIGRALAGDRRGGVTKKIGQRRLSWHLAWPLVATAGLVTSLVVAVFDSRPGASVVATAWAAVNASLMIGPLAALSERSTSVRYTTRLAQSSMVMLGIAGIAASVIASGASNRPLADPAGGSASDFAVLAPVAVPAPVTASEPASTLARPPASSSPATSIGDATISSPASASHPPTSTPSTMPVGRQALAPPAAGTYVGVSSEGVQATPGGVVAWSGAHAGARPTIVNWFQQWGSNENRFREDWVRSVAEQGAIPMITWEPWAKPDGAYADPEQAEFRLERIVAGDFDTYITAWADAAAAYGDPILVRFMHEFNGRWYPWSVGQQGQTAEQYVAAWRHVHAIFGAAGATNVSWVWSVIGEGFPDPHLAYPGDDVVDWVATTVLNSAWPEFGGWFEYPALTDEVYAALSGYGKPIMLSEVATNVTGGDPASWYRTMLDTIETGQPLVGAIVIFDVRYDDRTDYRLPDAAATELAAGMARDWFAPPIEVHPAD